MWIWLAVSIIAEVAATLALRASDGLRRRRWLAVAAAGHPFSYVFLARALSAGLPVGIGYGVAGAASVALVAIASRLLWNDPLSGRMQIGIGFVAAGVMLVALG